MNGRMGWFGDPDRHGLSARGVRTGRKGSPLNKHPAVKRSLPYSAEREAYLRKAFYMFQNAMKDIYEEEYLTDPQFPMFEEKEFVDFARSALNEDFSPSPYDPLAEDQVEIANLIRMARKGYRSKKDFLNDMPGYLL